MPAVRTTDSHPFDEAAAGKKSVRLDSSKSPKLLLSFLLFSPTRQVSKGQRDCAAVAQLCVFCWCRTLSLYTLRCAAWIGCYIDLHRRGSPATIVMESQRDMSQGFVRVMNNCVGDTRRQRQQEMQAQRHDTRVNLFGWALVGLMLLSSRTLWMNGCTR
ncbi:hypothetical protein F5887DRAFT_297465 [Amanita rubescens]|nr:hypothetical protein F5887DRAFT_297465 [Amanita rubescens]